MIRAVRRGQIPAAQYDAILIDEGDFRPEWFKLVVQMVDPKTNSLLVFATTTRSRSTATKRKKFQFQERRHSGKGRTTILRINYRNTDAILRFARDVAQSILTPSEADGRCAASDAAVGRSCRCRAAGNQPADAEGRSRFVVKRLKDAHRAGTPWREMAADFTASTSVTRS